MTAIASLTYLTTARLWVMNNIPKHITFARGATFDMVPDIMASSIRLG